MASFSGLFCTSSTTISHWQGLWEKTSYHDYVDDTHIYITISPSDCSPIKPLSNCIEQINDLMCHYLCLKL